MPDVTVNVVATAILTAAEPDAVTVPVVAVAAVIFTFVMFAAARHR